MKKDMAIRTKLLSGRNINTDSDFSKYIETVSEPGVIEGMAVSSGKVGVGKCWVPCERTNGETIYSLVENFTEITIDTSGTGFVIVSIPQNMIDDGSIINEDGTNVASIEVVAELPTKNYLELASINAGVITDERNMIKKVGELNTAIESLFSRVENIDERVEDLEKAGAINSLEEQALVGEEYSATDIVFIQKTPLADNCSSDCAVGDIDNNKEIHIQRLASGIEGDKLKIKVKKIGSPTTNFKVEVREGIKSGTYWYGDSTKVIATGTISYSDITTDYSVKEITLSSSIDKEAGTLLDIVCYQETGGSEIVNASNYYSIAIDGNESTKCFGYVNGIFGTKAQNFYPVYCECGAFSDKAISKIGVNSKQRGSIPYGFPKEVKSLGELAYVIVYGIIHTSYINKDIYVNTSGVLSDSNSNQFAYLGTTNKNGDILFNGNDISILSVKRTEIFNQSNTSESRQYSFTAPSEGFIQYYLYADAYYAYLYGYIENQEFTNVRGTPSGGGAGTGGTIYVGKGATVKFSKSGSNSGAGNAYFWSYVGK